jgi:hypothetical protein
MISADRSVSPQFMKNIDLGGAWTGQRARRILNPFIRLLDLFAES